VGDIVLYTNPQRLISPTLGIIIEEHNDISTDHRFFTVLLHTGKSRAHLTAEELKYIKRRYRVANLPDTFETGGIVGIAEITGCVQHHRSKWFQGPFGWTLAHARRLPFKPVKGQLKFFTPKF
jgi:hypothetical protein